MPSESAKFRIVSNGTAYRAQRLEPRSRFFFWRPEKWVNETPAWDLDTVKQFVESSMEREAANVGPWHQVSVPR